VKRRIDAVRGKIPPHSFFCQAEIDSAKVDALVSHIKAGGKVAPVVAVKYRTEYMPIDGHHRLAAFEELELVADAWLVDGNKFETLDQLVRMDSDNNRAEDFVFCDGVPALKVAQCLT